jgi:Domain of unknown function DUF11
MYLRAIKSRFAVALLSVGMVISSPFTASAQVDSGSDLAVEMSGIGVPVLPGATYTVSITNNGPEPLTSATVVVQLDRQVGLIGTNPPSPCPLDTKAATLTCSFGVLPVGSTASLRNTVYYRLRADRGTLVATATRTASAPADPDSGNDTDTVTCGYWTPGIGNPWPPPVYCSLI